MNGGDDAHDRFVSVYCNQNLNRILEVTQQWVTSGTIPEDVYNEFANNAVIMCSYARNVQPLNRVLIQRTIQSLFVKNQQTWMLALDLGKAAQQRGLTMFDPEIAQKFEVIKQTLIQLRQLLFEAMTSARI